MAETPSIHDDNPSEAVEAALSAAAPRRGLPPWVNGIFAGVFLYLFLAAINVMSAGLKTLGEETDWLRNMIAHAQNPFIALMGSVLITAIVQSSSFTTSLIVTLVAAGQMETEAAVFAVMGANIGTSVTNIIVALGNIRIRRQFRRAFSAALVHDIFNWLTVFMLFPLEWITSAMSADGRGVLTRTAYVAADFAGFEPGDKPLNFIKVITAPVVDGVEAAVGFVLSASPTQSIVLAAAGLIILFVSLAMMVKNLRGAVLSRLEALFSRVFFRNDLIAYIVGTITTILVQSSSVTTSLIVPLAGAGVVKIKRVFPYTLGANLGTTITGVIAALATDDPALAVPVAFSHVLFNAIGTLVWYPLRRVPIGLAKWYGGVAARSKRYAFLFLLLVFIVIPLIGVAITELIT